MTTKGPKQLHKENEMHSPCPGSHTVQTCPVLTRKSTVTKQPEKAWVGDNRSEAGGQNESGCRDGGGLRSIQCMKWLRNVREAQETWSRKQGCDTEGRPQEELQGLRARLCVRAFVSADRHACLCVSHVCM